SEKGILEPPRQKPVLPEDIDFIIVPGCGFTETGYRLGYGGGFYDRYLPKTNAVTCGFFYEALRTEFIPEETDIPLDIILTEKNIYYI
ncbi:MAG: 5-formyltetrahydrofolate cyclo-ligase, partial [Clostridia bacterium]|nr:5-formyltetrahydrofolate cyclo-ligase [Clostridia bacterium]